MNNQLSTYFEKILSKFQCGFQKGFNTQHCLLLMTENWKHAVDNSEIFRALLIDLSKAFDCVCHDLLIAKVNSYGLSLSALKLVQIYLQKRKKRTKNGITYSLREKIASGVPQGSFLIPFLFNIFLCDLFLSTESNYFTNYVDDTTLYVIGNNTEEVVSELKTIAEKLFIWFAQNEMKAKNVICFLVQPKRLTSKYQRQQFITYTRGSCWK